MNALIKNENCKFGNPRSRPTPFDLDLIRPEYKRPSGFFGIKTDVHPSISRFILWCNEDISRIHHRKHHSNFTKEEHQALDYLKNNEDILIKKADKGGAVVVWRKDLYIAEGERQLNDVESYQVLDSDNTDENNRIVEEFIKAEIGQDRLPPEAKVLIQHKPRCSIFYMLPKIHKVGNPGRPIESTCNCPTELISSYVDDVLQPIVSQLLSFCKDSTDVLYKLDRQAFNGGSYLFTMDVKSLYTVIPHSEGLLAFRYLAVREVPPTETVVRLAELVLTPNTFEFNDKFYTQTRGVAMGTKMGPRFANKFLGYIENNFFETYTGMKPTLYLRYTDDIFGLSDMTFVDIQSFIDAFCRFHPAVQFTFDIGKKVNFLDISVSVESENLVTTVYYKPTDSHSYLHYKSNHSRACKDAIPYSQFLRLCRLYSDDNDFDQKYKEMCGFFLI